MVGIGRIFEVDVLELLQQEGHALKAVAAVAVSAVGEEADHRLVDLHAAGASAARPPPPPLWPPARRSSPDRSR